MVSSIAHDMYAVSYIAPLHVHTVSSNESQTPYMLYFEH